MQKGLTIERICMCMCSFVVGTESDMCVCEPLSHFMFPHCPSQIVVRLAWQVSCDTTTVPMTWTLHLFTLWSSWIISHTWTMCLHLFQAVTRPPFVCIMFQCLAAILEVLELLIHLTLSHTLHAICFVFISKVCMQILPKWTQNYFEHCPLCGQKICMTFWRLAQFPIFR